MIEPGYNDGRDEHPFTVAGKPGGSVQIGANYVSQLINVLMRGVSWKDSVFILTWDEAGGFYDDVPPQATLSPDGIRPLETLCRETSAVSQRVSAQAVILCLPATACLWS
jgi:phospholipase C